MVTGGMLLYPQFREDQVIMNDEDGTWLVLMSWGLRGFFESQGYWASDGSPKLLPRDIADFGLVQLARLRDSFVAMAGRQDSGAVVERDQVPLCAP